MLPNRKDVDAINSQKLEDLPGTLMTYAAQDSGDEVFVRMLQRHCPAKTSLELKVGAQVRARWMVDRMRGICVYVTVNVLLSGCSSKNHAAK